MKFTFDPIKGDFGWYHQAKGINLCQLRNLLRVKKIKRLSMFQQQDILGAPKFNSHKQLLKKLLLQQAVKLLGEISPYQY